MDPIVASVMSTVIRFAASTAMDAELGNRVKVLAELAQRDDAFQQDLGPLARETGSGAAELQDCVVDWCARTVSCEEESAADLFAAAVVAAARIENSSLGNRNAQRLRNQPTASDIATFRGRWDQLVGAANRTLALVRKDAPATSEGDTLVDPAREDPQPERVAPAANRASRAGHDAMHRTILVVDIEQSSHPIRTDADQLVIRKALYQALTMAFKGNKRLKYYYEDRGDGALVLVPPEMPKVRVVTNLINRLEAAVERHNAAMERQDPARAAATQIRLRVAVHAGEITHDDHGVVGAAITHTFRLADAPPLKAAFDASPSVCALIVSDWFYNNVVYHNPVARPDCYERITCEIKETHVSAWMRVPFLPLGAEEPVQAVSGNRAAGPPSSGNRAAGPPSIAATVPSRLAGQDRRGCREFR